MIRLRHAFLSSLLATCAVALFTAVPLSVRAQAPTTSSSYFMVQGPLGAGGVYQTYKFRVEYTGVLSIPGFDPDLQNTGDALLAAVFGPGTTHVNEYYSNTVGGVSISSGLVNGFRMEGGTMVLPGAYPTGPQWGYFVSGGSYVSEFPGLPTTSGDYEEEEWTSSFTGVTGRFLEDGSIDAWNYAVMTDTGIDDDWGDVMIFTPPSNVLPTLADFSGPLYSETKISANGLPYAVYLIQSVPEPGRALLLLVGAGSIIMVRRPRSRRHPV